MNNKSPWTVLAAMAVLSIGAPAHANLLQNGSLEDPDNTWIHTSDNYMLLNTGSPALTGWSVPDGGSNGLAWGQTLTSDGYSAADGTYFIDLTGPGNNAPSGTIEQTITGLIVGETYTFSLSSAFETPDVFVDGIEQLAGGDPGSMAWVTLSGSFVAGGSTALFSLRNEPSVDLYSRAFVDNIVVDGATVPVPGAMLLLASSLALLGGFRRHRT